MESVEQGNQGSLGAVSTWWTAVVISVLVTMFVTILVLVPDNFFADDSYFYFQVAWNFAQGKGSTFNTIMPTNGYHPLWMLLCALVFRIFPAKLQAIHAIGGLIASLQVATLWTVRRILLCVAGDLWPIAFALLIPFLFCSQLGTEGALSGLALAATILFGYKLSLGSTPKVAFYFNLAASIAVLSRLDNIFIISFVWLAVWVALDFSGRRLQIFLLPIYITLWGTYIASNWIYFHTIQPIIGLLKSHSLKDHVLGGNLPHTAWLALAIVASGMVAMAAMRRDLFFRVIEVPFAAGVFCHAAYIVFTMSSETRWSWYYTSWILLAAILTARTASLVFEKMRFWALPISTVCLLLLAVVWYKQSYKKFYLGVSPVTPASFNDVLYKQAGVRRAFAFDQPGMLAYYSEIEIVPLDGLMGNLEFQHDLATKGLKAVIEDEHIDAFISLALPVSDFNKQIACDAIYLSTEQYHCEPSVKGLQTTAVDIYARIPGKLAGTLVLHDSALLWNHSDLVSVWRVGPSDVVH